MKVGILALTMTMLAAGAASGGMADRVQASETALSARILALDGPDATKDETKESSKLQTALGYLARYSGLDDAADLKNVLRAIKKIHAGKSPDAGVLGALEGLRTALDEIAGAERGGAVAAHGATRPDKRAKVQKRIDKGDGRRSDGLAAWVTSPKKGAKLLVKAIADFRAAQAVAAKYPDPNAPPATVFIQNTRLWNQTSEAISLLDIEYSVVGRLGGQPYSRSGKASVDVPGVLPIAIAAGDSYDFNALATAAISSDPDAPDWIPGDFLVPTLTLKTSVGDLTTGL